MISYKIALSLFFGLKMVVVDLLMAELDTYVAGGVFKSGPEDALGIIWLLTYVFVFFVDVISIGPTDTFLGFLTFFMKDRLTIVPRSNWSLSSADGPVEHEGFVSWVIASWKCFL